MRSIRIRLLMMLLALVTSVVGGLSWYVYEQTVLLLKAKELATAQLIRNQFDKRAEEYKEQFSDRLVHQAERLGRQSYERVELNHVTKLQTGHLIGSITSVLANPTMQPFNIPVIAQSLSNNSNRMVFELYAKRTIFVEDRALDGDEYFHIWSKRASVRSKNLPEDCFLDQHVDTTRLPPYEPRVQEEVLKCGKRFCMITLTMPMTYMKIYPGMEMGRTPMGTGTRRNQPRSNPSEFKSLTSEAIVVQIARETDHRDQTLHALQKEMNGDLVSLHQESEQVRKDTLNRLILICLATISFCALAITWVSRASLTPLVSVADAVTDLTPKDLRLKLHGQELDPRKMPEELAPIVQRLQESLESLDSAFAREKRATADISHELRTPLASLMTTVQVALRKPRTTEEYKTTLNQCVETGSHMTMLVERLLVLSRLDAGVDPVRKVPVNIVELAGQCVDMLRPIADQRNISIEMDVDDSANMLEPQPSDAAKLREVLVNLIDNAVHYNKDEGSVTLRIAAAPKSVILEVIDTGVGMTPDTQSHLFERFFRADPSRQSETVNAGLGLAIVKGYVDLFGGTISVSSIPGQGSTFRVTLPRVTSGMPVHA
ncbi:MAG TPA: HAMP domain-containing sensor histidine kinase [Gemmatales bacterium]|nr:HAMP domain-containing sensor histidine kinase [Gemmatales bacterium]